MTQANDILIIELIKKSPILVPPEKDFLIEKISVLGPLEKLKMKKAILANTTPDIIIEFRKTREEFITLEKKELANNQPIQATFTSKLFSTQPKIKEVLAHSILANSDYLGSPIPHPPQIPQQNINSLNEFTSLKQLNSLNSNHVSFNPDENSDQIIRNFMNKIATEFGTIANPLEKRNYFTLFLTSPLFRMYINTGLTALKHPEIKPANTILNTMQKIDRNFLNRKQFENVSTISSGIRGIIGL
jgi:hypothetical protein